MLAPKGLQLVGAAAITAAVGFGVFQNFNKGTRSEATAPATAESVSPTTNAPLAQISPNTATLEIPDPSQATEFTTETGTIIKVPANAFQDSKGKIVTGAVQLSFQELNTPEDIIAADIPMQVQKDAVDGDWLQTAGMFEIRAFTGDEAVAIAEGKAISVNMASLDDGTYNLWEYDENIGQWTTEGESSEPFAEDSAEAELIREEILDLEEQTRVRPVRPEADAANEQLIFSDLDVSKCPDFDAGKEIRLAYAGTDETKAPKNNQWISNPDIWFKKELICSDKSGVYTLKLFGEQLYEIPVRQALEGVRLEAAVQAYQQRLRSYQTAVRSLRAAQNRLNKTGKLRRTMKVANMGIHNYDVLLKMENVVNFRADFQFEDLPELVKDDLVIYLVTGDDRSVICLSEQNWKLFRFDPTLDNKIIAVLSDEQIAMFTQEDFKTNEAEMLEAKGGTYTFDMDVREGQIKSVDDLKEVLHQAEGIKTYPNPASEQLNVEYTSSNMSSDYAIYSQTGQTVRQGNRMNEEGQNIWNVNVSDLPSGTYYLQLDGSRAQPFVVAH